MTPAKEVVSIVVVTHNNWAYTKLFLESLRRYSSWPYRVICVDNHSSDETPREIKKYSEVELIVNKTNLGYGKAANVGFQQVRTKYFALLNNDIVASPNWLKNWLETARYHPQYWQLTTNSNCIIGPKDSFQGVDHDSWWEFKKAHKRMKPESLVKNYYQDYEKFCLSLAKKERGRVKEVEAPMGFLGGWALLMKKEIANKIGGFLYDERFDYGFYEDMDLSWRIALAGGKIGIARSIYLHHFINTTFDILKKDKHLIARHNKWKFLDKWEGLIKKRYAKKAGGKMDRLKGLMDQSAGMRSNVEYFGMKEILSRLR